MWRHIEAIALALVLGIAVGIGVCTYLHREHRSATIASEERCTECQCKSGGWCCCGGHCKPHCDCKGDCKCPKREVSR